MRLGRIGYYHYYVVDLDNNDMCELATISIYEDIMNAVKYDELHLAINVIEETPELKEEDIPEFLKEEEL